MSRRRGQPTPALPEHWTGEQALAVFECLQAMRDHLWTLYGLAVQKAWHTNSAPTKTAPSSIPTNRSDQRPPRHRTNQNANYDEGRNAA